MNAFTQPGPPPARPPLRALMTADAVGGVWSYALELAEGLGRLGGVEVILATMGEPPSPAQRQAAARLHNVRLCESRYKLEWMDDPWDDVEAAGEWLLELEARERPDVIHLNGYCHGALPWRAPVLMVAHSCVCSWFAAVRGEPAPRAWDAYRRAVARGLHRAGAVAAPSAFMLDALREHYGFSGAGAVIHNGRAAPDFAPNEKEPLIFTAGRLWDEAKNAATLDAAARLIPWPVFAAGGVQSPGGGAAALDHLLHLGRLAPADVAEWMGRAMVYAHPALYEPFGLTPLEAALAGCALVLGDIPSLREVWGAAALFVPPRDARALAAALERVMSDAALRRECAQRARARALELNPQRMIRQYLALYRDLLNAENRTLSGSKQHNTPLTIDY